MKRFQVGSIKEAFILWNMALRISPKEFKLLVNIATCLAKSHQMPEALDYLAEAEKNIPKGQEVQAKDIIDNFRKGNCAVCL